MNMKKTIALLLLLFLMASTAHAETINIIPDGGATVSFEETITIEDIAEFTVGTPSVADTLPSIGLTSDDRYEYIVVPVTLWNLGFEPITFEGAVSLSLRFMEKYAFVPYATVTGSESYSLLGTWIGRMQTKRGKSFRGITLELTEELAENVYTGVGRFYPDEYDPEALEGSYTVIVTHNPLTDTAFIDGDEWLDRPSNTERLPGDDLLVTNGVMGGNLDDADILLFKEAFDDASNAPSASASTTLDMLVEDTLLYVFNVPNAVANASEGRELIIAIAGTEYRIPY